MNTHTLATSGGEMENVHLAPDGDDDDLYSGYEYSTIANVSLGRKGRFAVSVFR